ncbi:MAG: DUF3108 domain-containing protein [Rhodopseudomonas sp.]|nr:DUF3108 domain-containing protein [Rhodopseudomonas sp.]
MAPPVPVGRSGRARGSGFVLSLQKVLRLRRWAAGAALSPASAAVVILSLVVATPGVASAQGRLEAQYTARLAGIPIGRGTWVVDILDNRYTAAISGETTGLMRAFTGGQGTSAARGTLQAGKPVSSIYDATVTTRDYTDETRFAIADGTIKDLMLDPPQKPDKERIPVTEENQRGALDPISASLSPVPGIGDPMSPEACQRRTAVFDGKMRYDLQMAYKRIETVKAEKGYAGPVVVCAVYFMPLAGYVPSRAAIRYLSRIRDMEVWLAPIAGTRLMVPFRIQGPTPIGTAVLEADEFVSEAAPIAAGVKAARPSAHKPDTVTGAK